jgi:hypothetical protein
VTLARTLVVALVVMTACGKKTETAPGPSAAGSAGSAAGDPWSKAIDAGAVADAPCDDADITKHIDNALGKSSAYLAALERRTARWQKDCEAAKQDLIALEPDATQFMTSMMEFKTWGETLSAACRQRVEQLGEQSPVTQDLERRTPALEGKVGPMLERCKDHPGFQEAAGKGLRVMRKKKPAPAPAP